MTILVIRAFLLLLCGFGGWAMTWVGYRSLETGMFFRPFEGRGEIGVLIGLAVGIFIIAIDLLLKRFTLRGFTAAAFGLLIGAFASSLVAQGMLFSAVPFPIRPITQAVVYVFFCYMGTMVAIRGNERIALVIPFINFQERGRNRQLVVVDTSVIIDGRLADVVETGFLAGTLIIPRFVLRELQYIADSADHLKRSRGRRGLDVLNRLQGSKHVTIQIDETDFDDLREVDHKLVKLAKLLDAKIMTNDFNLNKVAEVESVPVLNINDLANALKAVVLPGEMLRALIVKEGKEHDQGVAYLPDGTMIVVNHARSLIGREIPVTVSSVLQTSAGRMVFAELAPIDPPSASAPSAPGPRNTGGARGGQRPSGGKKGNGGQ